MTFSAFPSATDSRHDISIEDTAISKNRVGTQQEAKANSVETSMDSRFMIWVDGVGGFLVCLDDEIVIGQSIDQSHVQIPVLADISRRHVKIAREQGEYYIEPLAELKVNSEIVTDRITLQHRDWLTLGKDLEIVFLKPHPLSGTARLEIKSKHRTNPSCDSILLMSDSCIMGPRTNNHVYCRFWNDNVLLFRDRLSNDGKLNCKSEAKIHVDGVPAPENFEVNKSCRVEGRDFSFSFEMLS